MLPALSSALKRKTRRQCSAGENIRIVLDSIRFARRTNKIFQRLECLRRKAEKWEIHDITRCKITPVRGEYHSRYLHQVKFGLFGCQTASAIGPLVKGPGTSTVKIQEIHADLP